MRRIQQSPTLATGLCTPGTPFPHPPPGRGPPSSWPPLSPWQHPGFSVRDRASLWWHKAPLRGSGGTAPRSLWPISLWGVRQGPSAQLPPASVAEPRKLGWESLVTSSWNQTLCPSATCPSCPQKGPWDEPHSSLLAWGVFHVFPNILTRNLSCLDEWKRHWLWGDSCLMGNQAQELRWTGAGSLWWADRSDDVKSDTRSAEGAAHGIQPHPSSGCSLLSPDFPCCRGSLSLPAGPWGECSWPSSVAQGTPAAEATSGQTWIKGKLAVA